jgi:DNA-directed RNA polymerase subunit RPC12/RpoP
MMGDKHKVPSKFVKTELVCLRCGAHLEVERNRQHYKRRLVDRDPFYVCSKCGWSANESDMDLDEYTRENYLERTREK